MPEKTQTKSLTTYLINLELTEVDGIGEVTAQMITYLPQIFNIYSKEKQKNSTVNPCKTYKDIFNFFEPIYKNIKKEEVYIAYVNKDDYFIAHKKLADGDFCKVKFDATQVSKSVLNYKPKQVIICHNHPGGITRPSQSDYDSQQALATFLNVLGVQLYDSIIIDKTGFFSSRLNTYVSITN